MPPSSKTRQRTLVPLARETLDPLPTDPHGQRLCELFGRYLWCSIYADAPENSSEKAKWHTQRRYPLKNRVLWREWQDAAKLIGVRLGHETLYALLDIDINSPYHPNQDVGAITRMQAALETIGITRTLVIRSSWSEGIHLYIPLPLLIKTFDLAVCLHNCLEAQRFQVKPGDLEIFPNIKAYGTTQKIEYRAHRLPLQPGSGSCLLDDGFSPVSDGLGDFLARWDTTAGGQDITTLQKALPLARQNRCKKVRKRLNNVESWKADLETLLAEGWSGPGQTNQLLKEFGCYGVVFLSLKGEDLAHYVQQQAISSPGYRKWCRHQHEIEMRSRVWAAAVENYYWPLGSYSNIRETAENNIVPFNQLRAQQAQANIKRAVQHLEFTDQFPEQPTARAQAIRETQADRGVSCSSMETLYRPENKKLWHPEFYKESQEKQSVIATESDVSMPVGMEKEPVLETLKPSSNKELRTEDGIMKCISSEADDSSSAKTKFYSEKGGAGGVKSFPQSKSKQAPSPPDLFIDRNTKPILGSATQQDTIQIPKRPISSNQKRVNPVNNEDILKAVSETITAIQTVVRRLGWSMNEITNFIAEKFQGKRRAQLFDEELVDLLYYLQVQYLGVRPVVNST